MDSETRKHGEQKGLIVAIREGQGLDLQEETRQGPENKRRRKEGGSHTLRCFHDDQKHRFSSLLLI